MIRWIHIGTIILCSVIYCELLGDYVQILIGCGWPKIDADDKTGTIPESHLRAMILSDTHLLGPVKGHWLDKYYREWHMTRAFQASINIHQPEVVFVLGDLFDEGDLVNNEQYGVFVHRFFQHFRTPADVPIISAVGNHDVGFHYKMDAFITRFKRNFNNTAANLYSFKDIHFVFINSMSMANDGCSYCEKTQRDLRNIKDDLDCLQDASKCRKQLMPSGQYSRPIVMQHFPTYRHSDEQCKERDGEELRKYRENWEVLSKQATDDLGNLLNPRLAFSGHIHDYCKSINRWGVEEYTLASFSWRNKINPSFLMATFSKEQHSVFKCQMLPQQFVINLYFFTAILSGVLMLIKLYCYCKTRKNNIKYAKLKQ